MNKVFEYKQKVWNINYSDDVINIQLNRDEWNWVNTWIESTMYNGFGRLGKEWFEDLFWLIMRPINDDVNFSDKSYSHDMGIEFKIPRKLLRAFVYSIGRVAYSLDVKPITAMIAQKILNTINNQLTKELPENDDWFRTNF